MVSMLATGMSAASRHSTHSAVVLVFRMLSTLAYKASRFWVRCAIAWNRGSSMTSGWPTASKKVRHCLSVSTIMLRCPSSVGSGRRMDT